MPPLLSIDDISNWQYESLEQKFHERERFLLIYAYQIQNVDKMIDLLKTVFSNFITGRRNDGSRSVELIPA